MTERSLEKLRRDVSKAWDDRTICVRELCNSYGKKRELLDKKYKIVSEKCWLLQEKLDYYESDLIASDDKIEIRKYRNKLEFFRDEISNNSSNSVDYDCGIYLYGKPIKIGHIIYRASLQEDHYSKECGNIGYTIYKQYEGNGYAFKSLVLLSDYLFKNNIHNYYISVDLNNIASLKTVLKAILIYGGNIVSLDGNISMWQCNTKLKSRLKNNYSQKSGFNDRNSVAINIKNIDELKIILNALLVYGGDIVSLDGNIIRWCLTNKKEKIGKK